MSRLERAIGERPQTPQIRQAIVRIDAVRGHTEQCETCVTPQAKSLRGAHFATSAPPAPDSGSSARTRARWQSFEHDVAGDETKHDDDTIDTCTLSDRARFK
jgi:hypothetical protein